MLQCAVLQRVCSACRRRQSSAATCTASAYMPQAQTHVQQTALLFNTLQHTATHSSPHAPYIIIHITGTNTHAAHVQHTAAHFLPHSRHSTPSTSYVSFAEYGLFYRVFLQKRPIILLHMCLPHSSHKHRHTFVHAAVGISSRVPL